jgi:hypothetical protein
VIGLEVRLRLRPAQGLRVPLPTSRDDNPVNGMPINPQTIADLQDSIVALNALLTGLPQAFWSNVALAGRLTVGGQPFSFADFPFTADAAGDQLTAPGNPLQTGDGPLRPVNAGGTLPGNLLPGTDYYWIFIDASHGRLATTRANALAGVFIDITSNGTGTQMLTHQVGTTRVSDAEVTRNLAVDGGIAVAGTSTLAAVVATTLNASGLITANGGVQATHYNLPSTTFTIPAAAFRATLGSPTLDGAAGSGLWAFQSGANNTIECSLQLPVGTRITALKFHVNRASSSSGSIVCSLNGKVLGGGNVSTPVGTYSDTLSTGGTYITRDLIAIGGAPFTTIAGSAYWLEIDTNLNFTGAVPQFDGVEVTIDHS